MFFWSRFVRVLGSNPDDAISQFEIAGFANDTSVYNDTTDTISSVLCIHRGTRKKQIAQKRPYWGANITNQMGNFLFR